MICSNAVFPLSCELLMPFPIKGDLEKKNRWEPSNGVGLIDCCRLVAFPLVSSEAISFTNWSTYEDTLLAQVSSFTLLFLLQALDFPRHPSAASSTLVELTTRLDFFKERRSQLMEQLHHLDLNYGVPTSQDYLYRPSSPSWSWLCAQVLSRNKSQRNEPGVYYLYILLLIACSSPVILFVLF